MVVALCAASTSSLWAGVGCGTCAVFADVSDSSKPQAALDPKHKADIDRDIELGKKYAEEVDKELKPSKDQAMVDRVQRIAGELAAIAQVYQPRVKWGDARLNPFPYQFKVVEGKDVNAFSLPGGTIYVYEGLVKFAESDDELAGVLGHEIAHASLRHVATLQREASKMSAITLPLVLIGLLTGNVAAVSATQLFGQAIGSGWSVNAEQAADQAGFDYLRQSKYNPVGMLTFMERLAYEERFRPKIDWGIYRTHPPTPERARAMKDLLSSAQVPVLRSQVTTTFRANVLPAESDGSYVVRFGEKTSIYRFYGPDAAARASASASALNVFFDQEPRIFDATALDDRTLRGFRTALLSVEPADLLATGKTERYLRDQALEAIKTVIYRIRYRLWDG